MEIQQTEENGAKKPKGRRSRRERIILTALAVVCILGFGMLAWKFLDFKIYMDGQQVLGKARNVRIILDKQRAVYYAKGRSIADWTTETGLRPDVLRDIRELYDFSGTLRVTRCGKDGYSVARMEYTEGHYTAIFDSSAENENYWDVYFHWKVG